jgi:type II secretory pathway component PulF
VASFTYTAIDSGGKRMSGFVDADSRAAALDQVMARGLSPVNVQEKAGAKKVVVDYSHKPAAKMKLPAAAVESFTREMANLLAAGLPLARAMQLLKREASNPAARHVWTSIHDQVVGGKPLADALAEWPRVFSTVYVAMVRAGEAGGFLDVVLQQIADFRTREQDLKGKVKGAMVYPIVLAFLAVGVLIFLMTFFIPRFSSIFAEFGGNLPYLTQVIVAVSHGVTRYGLFIAVPAALGIIALKKAAQTQNGRRRIERVILATPALGPVVSRFALVRFCRMLGTLVGAGVPLVSSLRTAKEAIGNQILADTVAHAIEEVQRGASLAKSLGNSPQLFPASVIEMITVAEETGRLDKELQRLSVAFEQDLDRQLRLLVSLAEPIMLFMMAGLIGTVVLGMLLPVFNLQDLVH